MKKLFALIAIAMLSITTAHAEPAGPYVWNDAYLREAPSKVGAAYIQIQNPTQSDDALIGASATWAGRIELHEIKSTGDGVMHMSPVEKMPLPKNGTLVLQQGSYHLMIFDIKEKLNVDEKKEITLKFEKAGPLVIPFVVQPISGNPQAFRDKLIMDHSNHKM